MARKEACGEGSKHTRIGDVYERDETTCDEQLTTHLQCLEGHFERFGDQIGALIEQFSNLGVLMGVPVNQIRVSWRKMTILVLRMSLLIRL